MSTLSNTTTRSSSSLWAEEWRKKHLPRSEIAKFQRGNRSVATLNGSFDLLHAGHLQILYEASLQADILIVALNTDESIRGYKGPDRPLIPLEQRQQMIAALEFVDYVTEFDEPDPRALLKEINPDIHVNGSEYGKECIEAEVVKKIHIVKLVPGLSTSNIIRKICAS